MSVAPSQDDPVSARQTAFLALQSVHRGAFADIELDRRLRDTTLGPADRRLVTELVYGSIRRQRTLDSLINQLGKKKAHKQPVDLRHILHLGFYQLRYLNHIPDHAVVDTTVKLAKKNGLKQLSGVVNGMLRQYIRLSQAQPEGGDPLVLPNHPVQRLGVLHSYPDWIIQAWQSILPEEDIDQLCRWFNTPPSVNFRINPLQTSLESVQSELKQVGLDAIPFTTADDRERPSPPQALRIQGAVGNIQALPGYTEGHWMVQDSSAQLVSYLVDPQPGETIIDACAAPGGKTTHLAELMGDQGRVIGCDRTSSRTRKIQQNLKRLRLNSIETVICDSRHHPEFEGLADRVLLDVPCSGLGTLNRHADARWRQTPESVQKLVQLQQELLAHTATWVKPGGTLVYSTCTLHPDENEKQIQHFLENNPHWQIESPAADSILASWVEPQGWLKVWPHQHHMDGFFMVKLVRK